MPNEAAAKFLTLDVERQGEITIVRCHGKLVASESGTLYSEVSRLIPTAKRIVLDFADMNYMDSIGLGTVIRLYVSAKSSGCSLELLHLGKRVREMLGIANLLDVFTIVGENDIRM